MKSLVISSPVGGIGIAASDQGIARVDFIRPENEHLFRDRGDNKHLAQCIQQLAQYFLGTLSSFDLVLDVPYGTLFQREVWASLQKIPYASTCSYQDIAQDIQRPKAMRAVGNANRCNPIAIIIPCHRVIGSTGKLVGYAGGVSIKQYLIEMERRYHS
jgi:methylated-DNA-[protein]-cysteine S-methyltransferase